MGDNLMFDLDFGGESITLHRTECVCVFFRIYYVNTLQGRTPNPIELLVNGIEKNSM